MREADAARARAVEDRRHERAALAREADRIERKALDLESRRRAQHHAVRRTDDAEAIGPDKAHAAGAGGAHDLRLERGALRSLVGELAGDDDAAAHADPGRLR